MSKLRISLVQERTDQIYFTGSSITGSLLLSVTEPKDYKHVSIRFGGRAHVAWSEGSGDRRRSHSATEPYIDEKISLWSSDQSPDGKLDPGEYNWPFTFTIPPNVPSSFEATDGNIRYSLEGRVGTGLMKFDHKVEVRIPVQQVVSITDPQLLEPVRQEVQKTVCCLCCASGPVVLNVAVPKAGFCIGESFPVHVNIENGSSRQVTLRAAINQRVIYTAHGSHTFSSKVLSTIGSDLIEAQATRDWDPSVQVPPAPIFEESSCKIIRVIYSLVTSAQIPQALNLNATITIQLANQQQGEMQLQPAQGLPPNNTELSTYPPAVAPPAAPYPGLPGSAYPPSASTVPPVGWSVQPDPSTDVKKPVATLADIPAPVS